MNAFHVGSRFGAGLLSMFLLATAAGCGDSTPSGSTGVDPKIGERRKEMADYQKNNKTTAVEKPKAVRDHP